MQAQVSTTTAFATTIMQAYFDGFFGVLTSIMPFVIGIAVFYMGYNWVISALKGSDPKNGMMNG